MAGQDHLARVARAWTLMADLLGFRLRADCGVTFETLATLLNATMNGLLVTALTLPDRSARQAEARPFGAPAPAQWPLPALGLGAIASAFIEPDPEFTWDTGRAAALRQALAGPSRDPRPPGRAERPGDSPPG